eukprot:2980012-Pleurochrysis_carterae.AAC.1
MLPRSPIDDIQLSSSGGAAQHGITCRRQRKARWCPPGSRHRERVCNWTRCAKRGEEAICQLRVLPSAGERAPVVRRPPTGRCRSSRRCCARERRPAAHECVAMSVKRGCARRKAKRGHGALKTHGARRN